MSLDTRQKYESVSKDRLRLWLKLLKTQTTVEGEIRRRLRENFAMTLPRFDVMSALARYPDGLKMTEISTLLKVSNGNITGIVDRLVKDGLAVRLTVIGDRRVQSVRLSPEGVVSFEELAAAHEHWLNEILHPLERRELSQIGAVLDRFNTLSEAQDHEQ